MDWVESTGKTIEEAIQEALGQLGVSDEDADIVVLAEAKPGLFGRVRAEARVRARVRPAGAGPREPGVLPRNELRGSGDQDSLGQGSLAPAASSRRGSRRRPPMDSDDPARRGHNGFGRYAERGVSGEAELEVPLADQAEVARQFLVGVVERVGIAATVGVNEIDGNTVEVAVVGKDLAPLVGYRGSTVDALQDLARVVVQRRTGARRGRLLVDVAGYRQRRREALATFARERAEEVLRDGVGQVLEPMVAADRK
ncbi:MAG: Jag N-terminal domain-containing protein, partial [Acidimicrobiales bacterium]